MAWYRYKQLPSVRTPPVMDLATMSSADLRRLAILVRPATKTCALACLRASSKYKTNREETGCCTPGLHVDEIDKIASQFLVCMPEPCPQSACPR